MVWGRASAVLPPYVVSRRKLHFDLAFSIRTGHVACKFRAQPLATRKVCMFKCGVVRLVSGLVASGRYLPDA